MIALMAGIYLLHFGFVHSAPAASKRKVLILNSYHKGLSWTESVVSGIESILKAERKDIDLIYEYMDTKRYYSEQFLNVLYEEFKYKYRDRTFDAVIVSDNNALNFMSLHHKELFPGTPVVFCGINDFKDSFMDKHRLFTGIIEETNIKSTLEIALTLHPDITEVVSINDNTTTGAAVKNEILRIAPLFKNRIHFVFLENLDMEELKERVWKLPRNSIILLSVFTRDGSGSFFTYEESLSQIYSESSVPIYSFWDIYLGKGIVGGMLTSGYHQGQGAAQIALRILEGESPEAIPVVRDSPNRYMFDYQQLKLFNISQSDLPDGSIVINQPDTLYSRHKTLVQTTVFAMTSLVLTIIVLLAVISYRKRMLTALRDSEERYRDLYENAPDMYHSVNKDGIIIDCNETGARMLGYRKEEIIGKPLSDFFTEESREVHENDLTALKEKRVHVDLEREFVRKDGSTFTAGLNISTVVDEHGELMKAKTIARDLTERRRVEELKESQEQLRSLSAYLESAREEEKKRIARQIHDELGHALTTLGLDLTWLSSRLLKDRRSLDVDSLRARIAEMSNLIDSTVQTVQRISSELIPGVLDHLGLSEAIKWQLDKFHDHTGIKYNIHINPDSLMLDQNSSLTIFRIFQEALTNIMRHANATEVQVEMKESGEKLELAIKDNGKGIQAGQISSPESIGIIGIRERVRILGGKVAISGLPGEGTTVKVSMPVRPKKAESPAVH